MSCPCPQANHDDERALLCYTAQPTFREGNDLELSRWARYNHMIPKSRELSPTGRRREARESQSMRRIQCTIAA